MFDPSDTPPYAPPGPPARAATGRYVYLVARLRNRQITMEEATELFAIQQSMIRQSVAAAPPPPPPPSAPGGPQAALSPRSTTGAPAPSDDSLWLLLLALGAGAGVLSALAKRVRSEGGSSTTPVGAGATSRAGSR